MINVSEMTRQKRTDPPCAIYPSLLPPNDLDELIHSFEPVSLREMDSVALLNRVDTKFVLSAGQLRSVLRNLRRNYQVLSINQRRIHRYWTLYFDTQGFELYHDHVTGRAQIYKVRSREYLDTRLSYLEVKHKNQKRRTEKIRLPVSDHCDRLDEEMGDFLGTLIPFSAQGLEAKLWNTFKRITLVNQTDIEMGIGVGFGLFAIFTILRYRTDPIPIREMTYLFVIAALPVMNSAGVSGGIWLELAFANLAVLAILYVLERGWGFHYESYKQITYEKIELIKPENQQLLLADLQERTGLTIKRFAIGKVNFLRDTAEIKIYYDDPEQQSWLHMFDTGYAYATSENYENPTVV
jgi:hypothetical protein